MSLTENAVITGIQSITTTSSALCVTISNLNILNFVTNGYEMSQGLDNLSALITTFTNQITVSVPFDDTVAKDIVAVLVGFVNAHQDLLNNMMAKHSLASKFFLMSPILLSLHTNEKAVSAFAVALVALIPTQKDVAQGHFTALTATFSDVIKLYSS